MAQTKYFGELKDIAPDTECLKFSVVQAHRVWVFWQLGLHLRRELGYHEHLWCSGLGLVNNLKVAGSNPSRSSLSGWVRAWEAWAGWWLVGVVGVATGRVAGREGKGGMERRRVGRCFYSRIPIKNNFYSPVLSRKIFYLACTRKKWSFTLEESGNILYYSCVVSKNSDLRVLPVGSVCPHKKSSCINRCYFWVAIFFY